MEWLTSRCRESIDIPQHTPYPPLWLALDCRQDAKSRDLISETVCTVVHMTLAIHQISKVTIMHLLAGIQAEKTHLDGTFTSRKLCLFRTPSACPHCIYYINQASNQVSKSPPTYCTNQVSNYRLPIAFADGDVGGEDASERHVYHLKRMPFLRPPRPPTYCISWHINQIDDHRLSIAFVLPI